MTQIANIYPISNQKHYKKEEYVMILAHLLSEYNDRYFNDRQYIIMDNGLFEKAQVTTDMFKLIGLANNSKLPIAELVVPDAVNDIDTTIQLFEQSIPAMRAWAHEYNYMFVCQATTYEDLKKGMDYINSKYDQFQNEEYPIEICVGISKLSPLDRSSAKSIEIYKTCKWPIHFLGIKNTFSELLAVKHLVRSCDTSQIAFMAKNLTSKEIKDTDIIEYTRCGRDIDLAKDSCSDRTLMDLKRKLDETWDYTK